jgi:hypothetical protein
MRYILVKRERGTGPVLAQVTWKISSRNQRRTRLLGKPFSRSDSQPRGRRSEYCWNQNTVTLTIDPGEWIAIVFITGVGSGASDGQLNGPAMSSRSPSAHPKACCTAILQSRNGQGIISESCVGPLHAGTRLAVIEWIAGCGVGLKPANDLLPISTKQGRREVPQRREQPTCCKTSLDLFEVLPKE